MKPEAFGARGDAKTNDTDALKAAIRTVAKAGGGTVILDARRAGYRCDHLTLPSGVSLVGAQGRARLIMGATRTNWISTEAGSRSVQIGNLTLDTQGRSPSAALFCAPNSSDVLIARCEIRGAGTSDSELGVDVGAGCAGITIADCVIARERTGIRINRAHENLLVTRCHISGWRDHGLIVLSADGMAPRAVSLIQNTVTDMAPGGRGRQGIAFMASGSTSMTSIRVIGNTVTGPRIDNLDPSSAGSSDLLSLHGCNGFEVSANRVSGSGEVGITIAQGCSNGLVERNVASENDTAGIDIGASSGPPTTNIRVLANVCVDNGQDYGHTKRAAWARSGIVIYNAHNVTVKANKLSNTTTGRQLYGISVTGGSAIDAHEAQNTIISPRQARVLRR